MLATEIGMIYADALFRLGKEKSVISELYIEFSSFIEIYNKYSVIAKFLNAPAINRNEKIELIRKELSEFF